VDETPELLVRVRLGHRAGGHRGRDPEVAAFELWAAGASAVELIDDTDGTTLLAGYPTPEAARTVASELADAYGAEVVEVEDRSWRDAWRRWAEPSEVGAGLTVVPAWREVPVGSGRTPLVIDPGDCFGSGTHASTRMILAWLDSGPPRDLAVADIGCGSGILAVAAALLGAASVVAVDIDPAAVAATQRNCSRNGVGGQVAVSTTPVADLPAGRFDVVLVNVTAGVHAAIGPDCSRVASPSGVIVVAGLLPGQWRHVASSYEGWAPSEELDLDGWEGAVLRRRRD
jgi:ribosomal protein L11 methyltransferase